MRTYTPGWGMYGDQAYRQHVWKVHKIQGKFIFHLLCICFEFVLHLLCIAFALHCFALLCISFKFILPIFLCLLLISCCICISHLVLCLLMCRWIVVPPTTSQQHPRLLYLAIVFSLLCTVISLWKCIWLKLL